jgi:hypothetical protein
MQLPYTSCQCDEQNGRINLTATMGILQRILHSVRKCSLHKHNLRTLYVWIHSYEELGGRGGKSLSPPRPIAFIPENVFYFDYWNGEGQIKKLGWEWGWGWREYVYVYWGLLQINLYRLSNYFVKFLLPMVNFGSSLPPPELLTKLRLWKHLKKNTYRNFLASTRKGWDTHQN